MASPGYTILLMNTGKDGTEPSPAAKRQEAFTQIVEDVKPSIIFTQECTGPFAVGLGDQYLKIGIPEAGFIYNVNEFVHQDFTLETDLATLVNRLARDQSISRDFQFLGRVRLVRFTSKGVPDLDILALSWHGQYSALNDETKIKFLNELFVVVKEMQKLKNKKFRGKDGKMLPVIVGGDFNVDVTKWPSDPDLVYHMYTQSERRKDRLIDLFVSTKELTVKNCTYVDMSLGKFKLKDGKVAGDYLKHDPVKGELSLGQATKSQKASPNEKPKGSTRVNKPKKEKTSESSGKIKLAKTTASSTKKETVIALKKQ